MSINTEMTALADAVREKSGLDRPLSIRDMTEAVGGFDVVSHKEYLYSVYDYDGTLLARTETDAPASFTLPDPPIHDGLVFSGWISTAAIVDGSVTVTDNDVAVGALYLTASGLTELDILLDEAGDLTVSFQPSPGLSDIDWGDGTHGSAFSHTYAAPGAYTLKLTGISSIPGYFTRSSATAPNNSLVALRLGTSVNYLSQNAFAYCNLLKTVTLGNVRQVAAFTFRDCPSLRFVNFPTTAVTVANGIFSGCLSLEGVVFPSSLQSFGAACFEGCPRLSNFVFPCGLTRLYGRTFYPEHGIKRVIIPSGVSSLGEMLAADSYGLTDVRIPDTVTNLGASAFKGCVSLRSVTLPPNIEYIPANAFRGCISLSGITLPGSVERIMSYAFADCSSVTNVVFPAGFTEISTGAFSRCTSLTVADFSACTSVPTMSGANVFDGTHPGLRILVPGALYRKWKKASYWSSYAARMVPVGEVPDVEERPDIYFYPSEDIHYNASVGDYAQMISFASSEGTPSVYISNGTDTIQICDGEPLALDGVNGTVYFYSDYYEEDGKAISGVYDSSCGWSFTFTAPGTYEIYGEVYYDGEYYPTGKYIYTVT